MALGTEIELRQGLDGLVVPVTLAARLRWVLSDRSTVGVDDYGAVAGIFLVGDVGGFGRRLEGLIG